MLCDICGASAAVALDQFGSLQLRRAVCTTALVAFKACRARTAQGKSAFARLGGNARVVGLVGMGKQEKATPIAEWGPSAYQARLLTMRPSLRAAVILCGPT